MDSMRETKNLAKLEEGLLIADKMDLNSRRLSRTFL